VAEDTGDKTEAPTPKRRQQAREQGNIARSPDLVAAVAVIAAMILLKNFGPGIVNALKLLMTEMLSSDWLASADTVGVGQQLTRVVVAVMMAVLPVMLGLMFVGVVVNVLQVGLYFNTKKLQPNLLALNPFKGLKRVFGMGRGPVPMLLNLAKLVIISLFAYSAIHDRLPQIVMAQQLSFTQIFGLAGEVVYAVAIRIGVVLLVLALVDYLYQRWDVERKLKMTKQEVKDEMRSMDGDPMVKQRRRQLAMQMLKNRVRKDVPTADVVVTNPTEFAVALKYDAGTMHAPRVVAKGQGPVAKLIREVAIANGIPILERKPLARALYKLVNVGEEIPEQFYAAVAEILAYVYELSGKMMRRAAS
jgi:flagellar biosynthesis protein FlhB